MAGHNKWSSIKHKKAKTDAQRGKLFSKIAREIVMAAKLGGGDADMNPRLRLALQKAKEANMPNDNINRAVQKGAGGGDDTPLEELQFEAYGPHGVAILIDVLTDNRNRTVSNLKTILNKGNANMAQKGAVSYLFETKGLILFDSKEHEDTIVDLAIEADAEDVETKDENSIEIVINPTQLETLKNTYDAQNIVYATATITKIPSTIVTLNSDELPALLTLIEKIEEDDDVQDVYANFDGPNTEDV